MSTNNPCDKINSGQLIWKKVHQESSLLKLKLKNIIWCSVVKSHDFTLIYLASWKGSWIDDTWHLQSFAPRIWLGLLDAMHDFSPCTMLWCSESLCDSCPCTPLAVMLHMVSCLEWLHVLQVSSPCTMLWCSEFLRDSCPGLHWLSCFTWFRALNDFMCSKSLLHAPCLVFTRSLTLHEFFRAERHHA